MVVPRPVVIALGLHRGEHVVLRWNQRRGVMEFEKFILKEAKDGGHTFDEDNGHRGRNAQEAIGG